MMRGRYFSKPSVPFPRRNGGTRSLYILLPERFGACMSMCVHKDIKMYKFYRIGLFFLFYSMLGVYFSSVHNKVIYSF